MDERTCEEIAANIADGGEWRTIGRIRVHVELDSGTWILPLSRYPEVRHCALFDDRQRNILDGLFAEDNEDAYHYLHFYYTLDIYVRREEMYGIAWRWNTYAPEEWKKHQVHRLATVEERWDAVAISERDILTIIELYTGRMLLLSCIRVPEEK